MIKHSTKHLKEIKRTKPNFVDDELYYSTDLVYSEVYLRCKELGAKKMMDISDITIQEWYAEFLKAGWDTAKFLRRIETVKNLRSGKDYFGNGIDISHWLNEDLLVMTLGELERVIKVRIDERINRGNYILGEYCKAFQIQDDNIKLAISEEIAGEYERHRGEIFSLIISEAKKKARRELSERRSKILEMNDEERKALLTRAVEAGIISKPANEKEKKILVENLEVFADKLAALIETE